MSITEKQVKMLEEIGMIWNTDTIWDKRFKSVEEFFIQNKRCPNRNSDSESEKKWHSGLTTNEKITDWDICKNINWKTSQK